MKRIIAVLVMKFGNDIRYQSDGYTRIICGEQPIAIQGISNDKDF